MDGRLHKHIFLEIIIDKSVPYAGLCSPDDDNAKPKYFTITLNPNAPDPLLQNLAHEMVHLFQYATGVCKQVFAGRPKELVGGKLIWFGEEYDFSGNDDLDTYENYPWEVQAWEMEEDLYVQYVDETLFVSPLQTCKVA